jgi:hypothetical protein
VVVVAPSPSFLLSALLDFADEEQAVVASSKVAASTRPPRRKLVFIGWAI